MNENANMAQRYEHEIPEGYEARIEGGKVIIELKESEDERIRKALIHLISEQDGILTAINGISTKDILAYLEKQKEQPTNEEMLRILRAEYEKGVADTIAKYEQIPIFRVGDNIIAKDETCIPKQPFHIERIEDDCYWDGNNSILVCNQDDFQLIEQQPAEWSEVDKSILNNIVAYKVLNIDDLEWLKSLPERFNLQPKQGWSEEDCKIIESINMVFDACAEKNIASEKTTLHKLRAWLKFLPERINLPARQEWGEENEKLWVHDDDIFLDAAKMIVEDSPRKSYGGVNKKSIVPWFYSLKERLKSLHERVSLQSKAEWSENYIEEDLRTRFAFYTYKDEDDVLYLSNVFVEETSRNKGFGTKILAAAEKVAETIGAINIRLKVKRDSPANAWYRKHGYSYIAFEEDYDWLEKALEYQKPSKQEWSEEDERLLRTTLECLNYVSCQLKIPVVNWLKSLPERFNLQPKQEWSEEDINNFNRIVEILVEGSYSHPWWSKESLLTKEEMDKLTDWFKTLCPKPHWKPSEEQIGALNYAYCELFKRKDAGHNILSPLQKLIDDLQKLL